MTYLTNRPEPTELTVPAGRPLPPRSPEVGQASELWGVLNRHRWLILGSAALAVAVAGYVTYTATPVYQATATLRIDAKQPNLPEVFRDLTRGSLTGTEVQVLRSRSLVEDAVDRLGLRLRVLEPEGAKRSDLLADVRIAPAAPAGTYEVTFDSAGRAVVADTAGRRLATAASGEPIRVGGASFRLLPTALERERLVLAVQPVGDAAASVRGALSVDQAAREATIVTVTYEGTDPEEVRAVPNVLATRYMARRQESQRTEARSSVKFLTEQLERVSRELVAAEDTFRRFRETGRVIDPETEATKQVSRLVDREAERSSVVAERDALARSLEEVNATAARRKPGDPSPYRQLLAFPTLLRNHAASQLLSQLATIENERVNLLLRRTPADPDVQVLTARVTDLEQQLHALAVNYLQGLNNQVASLDASLQQFGRGLSTLPRKQVEFARLQRKSGGLEEVYNLLQTRLKEAEIAQAVEDPSVQVVDTAVTPRKPIRPRPAVNLAGALVAGLLIGAAGGLLRERFDKSVHTRRDIFAVTGLPVLGMIPHTSGRARRIGAVSEVPRRSVARRVGRGSSEPADGRPAVGDGSQGAARPAAAGDVVSAPTVRVKTGTAGTLAAEAYGMLHTNLAFARGGAGVKTMVLTSPLPGDGKSTCAVNLALTMACRGLRTLLIDGDLRRGVVHQAFGVARGPGLAEVLHGSVGLEEAVRTLEVGQHGARLDYVTAGAPRVNPSGLVESAPVRALLDSLRDRYDRIVIDSPPVNIVSDAALLSAGVDGVVLVARSGVTESAALAFAMDQLRAVGAPIVGVVLNDIDFRRDAAYDRSLRYYNYNEYLETASS